MDKSEKIELIEKVIAIELTMFLTVPVVRKAGCQENPIGFRLNRSAQFLSWSEKTLNSYLADLTSAREAGLNLMTIKYARMENLIPRENKNPLVDKIVNVQYAWQEEVFQKYPHLMRGARPLGTSADTASQTSFETYMRCELETYSNQTLSSLYSDMLDKLKRSINMSEEILRHLATSAGYESLEAAELAAKARIKRQDDQPI